MNIFYSLLNNFSLFSLPFWKSIRIISLRSMLIGRNVILEDIYDYYYYNAGHIHDCQIVFKHFTFLENMEDRIDDYITSKKAFLDPDLKMERIAREVGTNRTYISNAMKSKNGFNAYINRHRIIFMAELLKEDSSVQIEDAIYISGFKSKRTFQNVLREYEGNEYAAFIKKRYLCERNDILI